LAKLIAQGFGPFERLEVELKPLTVIVGRNSVGKSMILYLLWTLSSTAPDFARLADLVIERGAIGIAGRVVEALRGLKSPDEPFKELLRLYLEAFPHALASSLASSLKRTFTVELIDLIHEGFNEALIRLTGLKGSIELAIKPRAVEALSFDVDPSLIDLLKARAVGPRMLEVYWGDRLIVERLIDEESDLANLAIIALARLIGEALWPLATTSTTTCILADGRAGLARTLLKPYAPPRALGEVSQPDEEYIRLYFRLAEKLADNRIVVDAVTPLLRELGCVRVEPVFERGAHSIYMELWTGRRLPLERAPSGLREALTTALALASRDEPSLVIIEEPEAHLHPAAQRALARLIAWSINNLGKHVALTTHSDYMLYSLSNLIELSGREAEEVVEMGYDPSIALRPEQVSAYLAKANGRKATLERLEVTAEGIPEDEFTTIAGELAEERSRLIA